MLPQKDLLDDGIANAFTSSSRDLFSQNSFVIYKYDNPVVLQNGFGRKQLQAANQDRQCFKIENNGLLCFGVENTDDTSWDFGGKE